MTTAIYNKTVLEHFERPQNVWLDAQNAPAESGGAAPQTRYVTGCGGSVSAGVWIAFELGVDALVITNARFRAYGCPHSIALASWLTKRLVGEKLDSGYTLDQREIGSVLDLPTEKMRSVLVAEDAIRACANQLDSKEAC